MPGPNANDAALPKLPPGYVARPRLSAQLDAFADRALLVVRGVAGSGKTTLIAGWVRERENEEVVWLTLDRTLRSPADFWRALAGVIPEADRPEELAAASFAAWVRRQPRPVNIVIDDAHFAHPSLADDLIQLSQEVHRGRVILGSRALTNITDALAVIQTTTGTLDMDDLSYRPDEVRALLSPSETEADDAEAVISSVLEATAGHALLTRLALSSDLLRTPAGIGRVASHWAAQLLPNHLRGFAFRISLEDRVDAAHAKKITGDSDSGTKLDELVRDGLGSYDTDHAFSFHELLGAALSAHARSIGLPIDGTTATEVSDAIAEQGSAHEFDWPHFAQPTVSEAEDMTMLLAELPAGAPAARELVAASTAVVQARHESVPSVGLRNSVDVALGALESTTVPDGAEERLFRELAIQALLWAVRRHDEGGNRGEALLAITRELDVHSRSGAWSSAYWGLLYSAIMLTLSAELDRAEDILVALESDHDTARSSRRLIQRAFIFAMRGEIAGAARLLEDAGELQVDSVEWTARLAITRAAIELENGDPLGARATLTSIEPDLPRIQEWPYALVVTARTHLATDPVAGIEAMDRLLRQTSRRPITKGVRDLLDSAIGDLALAAGDITRVKRLVARRDRRDIALRLTAARVALITGDRDAVDDLRALTEEEGVWPRLRAQSFLLLTVHCHRLGDADGADDALRRALAITGGQGIRLILSLIPQSELQDIAERAGVELPRNVNGANPLERHLVPVALTARERHLLDHLASPALLREIASAEFVTLSTIKSQAASLYRKLNARSRDEAVAIARRRGLL